MTIEELSRAQSAYGNSTPDSYITVAIYGSLDQGSPPVLPPFSLFMREAIPFLLELESNSKKVLLDFGITGIT